MVINDKKRTNLRGTQRDNCPIKCVRIFCKISLVFISIVHNNINPRRLTVFVSIIADCIPNASKPVSNNEHRTNDLDQFQ